MIRCCSCKKEYDFEGNIFRVDRNTNCPILICPHCGFKHAVSFMPFENRIENLKKAEKIELATNYPLLGASRIATAARVDVSDGDDADVKNGVAWEINSFVYDKSKNVEAQDITVNGVWFNPDGTRMYILGYSTDTVYQYDLSTAYDVDTATYNNVYVYIGGTIIYGHGFCFSADGTKMYVLDGYQENETIWQFTLTTAWLISSAVYAGKSFFIRNVTIDPSGCMFLHPSGTYIYVLGDPGDILYQLELTTPYDISTAVEYREFDLTDEDFSPQAVFFAPGGQYMFIMGDATETIFQYYLSAAWDVSSAAYLTNHKDISSQDTINKGLFFKPDGTIMYHIGRSGDGFVYQYKLSEAWVKTNDFILATRIYGSKGVYNFAYKLKWRNVTDGGVFADIGATGEISFSANTVLVDGQALAIGNKICGPQSGYDWQNGMESEGDNRLPDSGTYSLADEYYTEFQWALDCNSAHDEDEYEFALYELTNLTLIGTCLAKITMAITIIGGLSMKWNGVAISKWDGVVINKLNGVD